MEATYIRAVPAFLDLPSAKTPVSTITGRNHPTSLLITEEKVFGMDVFDFISVLRTATAHSHCSSHLSPVLG